MSDEKRYALTREAYSEAIQEIKKWKVDENTIRVIIYRAFSKKGGKYYKEEYGVIRRLLVSCLYQAHPDAFMQVIKMSNGNT